MKKQINELEAGQRFKFDPPEDFEDGPHRPWCVYAGASPCGRWFAYWERRDIRTGPNLVVPIWSIEETDDGSEEVTCDT